MAGEDFPYLSPFPTGFEAVELQIAGTWVDVTADLSQDGITIVRGRQDEGAAVEPSVCRFALTNTDGRYSPRNPASPYFGQIGRNTPVRASVTLGETRVVQPAGTYWSTPDNAVLDITGDIDLRVDIDPPSWRPPVSSYCGLLKDTAYGLFITPDGYLSLQWWTSAVTSEVRTSTVPIPGGSVGRKAIRATLDVNNGAGGHTVRFYSAPDLFSTYVEFGEAVITTGITSIFVSTGALRSVCTTELGTVEHFGVRVLSGIAGTPVASSNFKGRTEGITSFTDPFGRAWTTGSADAKVTARSYRFWGEVVSWPQDWGRKGGPSVITNLECAGIMRRLNQGASPVRSPLFRGCSTLGTNLVGYWPLEDLPGARVAAAGVSGVSTARLVSGAPRFAAYDGFLASAPALVVGTSKFSAPAKSHTATGAGQVRFSGRIPASTTNNAALLRVRLSGGIDYVDLVYTTGGNLTAKAYDDNGTLLNTGGTLATGGDDVNARYSLELTQVGADVKASIVVVLEGETAGFFLDSTFTGRTMGRILSVEINPNAIALTDFAIAHLTVEKAITSVFDLVNQFNAWIGERADDRVARLALENNVTVGIIGAGGASQPMGYQPTTNLLALLREAAASDFGLLYEPRDSDDLAYRTLESLYDQDPLAVTYTDNLVQLQPVDDDQATRNLVVVTRDGGSSATAEQTTGPLSTQAPPAGVGTYDDAVTLSLAGDGFCDDQAGWRVHLGTVDRARYPVIGIDLAHPDILSNAALTRQLLALDLGDQLDLSSLPAWLPPGGASVIVQGYTEAITPKHHRITLNTSPAAPYRAARWAVTTDRWSDPGATLAADPGTGGTTLTITPSTGVLWTHDDGDYDVLVGGEQMTVTAVAGVGPTQDLTVTRSVNGVVAAHPIGTAVELYDPTYYRL